MYQQKAWLTCQPLAVKVSYLARADWKSKVHRENMALVGVYKFYTCGQLGSFQWIDDDISLEGLLLLTVPFIATGETIFVVQTLRVISSASTGPRTDTLIQMGLGNIPLPQTPLNTPSLPGWPILGKVGLKTQNKYKAVVNIDTIENQPSHRMWIILSSDNINRVGECLYTITHI